MDAFRAMGALARVSLDYFVHDIVSTSYMWLLILGVSALAGARGFAVRGWWPFVTGTIKAKLTRGGITFVVLVFLAFFYAVAHTIYIDHISARATIVKLKTDLAAKENDLKFKDMELGKEVALLAHERDAAAAHDTMPSSSNYPDGECPSRDNDINVKVFAPVPTVPGVIAHSLCHSKVSVEGGQALIMP